MKIVFALLLAQLAYGQCGKLAFNPITKKLDCIGTSGAAGATQFSGLLDVKPSIPSNTVAKLDSLGLNAKLKQGNKILTFNDAATCTTPTGTISSTDTVYAYIDADGLRKFGADGSQVTGCTLAGTGVPAFVTGLSGYPPNSYPIATFTVDSSNHFTAVVDDRTAMNNTHLVAGDPYTTVSYNSDGEQVIVVNTGLLPSGGSLESKTASSSASLDFTTCLANTSYDDFRLVFHDIVPSASSDFWVRVSTNAGVSFDTGTNYNWANAYGYPASGGGFGVAADTKMATKGSNAAILSGGSWNGSLTIHRPRGSIYKIIEGTLFFPDNGVGAQMFAWGGIYLSNTAVNAIQIKPSTGNFTSGDAQCYGIPK